MIIFLMCNPDDSGGGQSYESVLLFNNFNFYKALVKIIVAKKIKREKKLVRSQLSIQQKNKFILHGISLMGPTLFCIIQKMFEWFVFVADWIIAI